MVCCSNIQLECRKIFRPRSSFRLILSRGTLYFLKRSTLSSCFSFQMLRMRVSAKRSLGKRSTKTPSPPWPSGLNNCSSKWRWPNSHLTVLCSTTFKTPRISIGIRLRSPLAIRERRKWGCSSCCRLARGSGTVGIDKMPRNLTYSSLLLKVSDREDSVRRKQISFLGILDIR